jgi:hypothetical protein
MSELEQLTYLTTDQWGREFILCMALRQAQDHPAKPRPDLRLVASQPSAEVTTRRPRSRAKLQLVRKPELT